MKKVLLAGLVALLAVTGCGDKGSQPAAPQKAAEPAKAPEPTKKPEEAAKAPEQPQAAAQESKEALLARHMKCREEKGTDCFKILEEMKGQASQGQAPQAQAPQAQAPKTPEQQLADNKAHNDAVLARHMKCRQENGKDCLKILEEMRK